VNRVRASAEQLKQDGSPARRSERKRALGVSILVSERALDAPWVIVIVAVSLIRASLWSAPDPTEYLRKSGMPAASDCPAAVFAQ
jgi:hypothetical protein